MRAKAHTLKDMEQTQRESDQRREGAHQSQRRWKDEDRLARTPSSRNDIVVIVPLVFFVLHMCWTWS